MFYLTKFVHYKIRLENQAVPLKDVQIDTWVDTILLQIELCNITELCKRKLITPVIKKCQTVNLYSHKWKSEINAITGLHINAAISV